MIKEELQDFYSQANTYNQLGRLAQEVGDYSLARENFHKALLIYIQFGDLSSQAIVHNNLGLVAQMMKQYDEAKKECERSLAISIQLGDGYSQARTYHNLGVIASSLREYVEARQNHQKSLSIWYEFKDEYSIQTFSIPSLSRLYQATQDQNLLEEISQVLGITVEEVRQKLELT